MMPYSYRELENERWGIFINDKLVASIGCVDTCKQIVHFLESRSSNKDLNGLQNKHTIAPYFHEMKLRP